jgi:thiosulfate reductase cytochrome b subunit
MAGARVTWWRVAAWVLVAAYVLYLFATGIVGMLTKAR